MNAWSREPVTAFVALGANLGDAAATVRRAMAELARLPQTQLMAQSPLYASAPVDAQGPDYVNAVAQIATRLPAPVLLAALLEQERVAGRTRPYRHAPRTLDLDLLLYGDGRIDSPALTLPHPRLDERAFVLRPLADIAPERVAQPALRAVAGQRVQRLPDGAAGPQAFSFF